MAKYGFDDFAVSIDDSAGSPTVMSNYITSISVVNKEAITEESHAAGDAWVEHLFAGIRRLNDITLGGFYDDTASTGPNVIFDDVGCVATSSGTRTLLLTYGGTKTTSVEVIIVQYNRMPTRNESTKFEVVLRPTGTVTEA